jgi:ABC-type transport system substrate-binding protein
MGRVGTLRQARRLLPLGLPVFVAASLIWGISGAFATSSSPVPSTKVILRVGWTQEPDNLNPFIGYETSAYEVIHLNYDLMVGFKASDLSPAPELATSWTHSSDGKVWTFKIRQGVKWQDGLPFTAKDVAFTYNYIIKNQLSAWASYCTLIKKVTAPDDSTAVFYCSKPKANILATWVPIVPEHIWSKISPGAAENSFANKPPIIGTGPFQCVEWKHGQYVRMVANKSYWKGAPKIDEVIFQNYQNHDTMAMDLKAGGIQAAWGLPDASFNNVAQTPGLTALAYGGRYEDELGMNCYDNPDSLGNPVLRDPRFRQALNWAVDASKLVQVAYSGHALPGTSVIPADYYDPALDWHWEPPASLKYTFDLNKARAALDAAGYRDTNADGIRDYQGKPIVLRLFVRNEAVAQQKAAKLIASWFKRVGLEIDYSVMSTGAMSDRIYNMKGNTFAPRLRPLHVELGRRRGPRLHHVGLHYRSDQLLERLRLVEQRVRPPVPAAGYDHRPSSLQGGDLEDGGDALRAEPLHRAHLSIEPRGVQHEPVDRLGALPCRQGRRLLRSRQHRQLPLRATEDGGSCEGRWLRVGADRRRRRGRRGRRRRHILDPPSRTSAQGRGLSSGYQAAIGKTMAP